MGVVKTVSENKIAAYLVGFVIVATSTWLAANTDWPWKVNHEGIVENAEHLGIHDVEFIGVQASAIKIEESLLGISAKLEQFIDVRTNTEALAQVMIGPGVKLNRTGRIASYGYFAKRMEIINRDHPDRPMIIVDVTDETFANENRDLVLKVGREVAGRLEVPADQWFFRIKVRRIE